MQPNEERVPLKEARQIDKLCDEFEAALAGKTAPVLSTYLDRVDAQGRSCLLFELVALALPHLTEEGVDNPAEALMAANEPLREELKSVIAQLGATVQHDKDHPARHYPRKGLHVRCPHCHNPIEFILDSEVESIHCPLCGSDFSLTGQSDDTHLAREVSQIGQFKLVERIGIGAFGTVWKALDTELDRTVAVKIPRRGQLDNQQREVFLREARSAAQLRHPNIVSVHEVGRDGDTLYIVSDMIRGVTLSDWLTGQKPTIREAVELAIKVAEALHHAHERGVIHRDLKPGNIMIDAEGEPHLMDFGLARREAGEVTMTLDGQVLGTPAYMSPEQAAGEAHTADRRSDVYSLGVILFQLLTGELPFRGNTRMLLHQVIHDEPPGLRKLNASVPRDIETICLKCMEKEPSRRYQTASTAADDLRHALQGKPIKARPIGKLARGWRWCRRNPVVAALVTLVMAAFLFGFLGVTWQWHRANAALENEASERKRAELAELKSYESAVRGQRAAIDSSLSQSRLLREVAGDASQAQALAALTEAGSLRIQAQRTIEQMASRGRELSEKERTDWEQKLPALRAEAIHWLTKSAVKRVRSVALPGPPQSHIVAEAPIVATRVDGDRFVVVFPFAGEIVIVGHNGTIVSQRNYAQEPDSRKRFPMFVGSRGDETQYAAVSPSLERVVAIRPASPLEIVVFSTANDNEVKPLPLPSAPQFRHGIVSRDARLQFENDDKIVLDGGTFLNASWEHTDGNWVLSEANNDDRFGSSMPRHGNVTASAGPLIAGALGPYITLSKGERDQAPRQLFRIEPGEECRKLTFSPDGSALAIQTSARIVIADIRSGAFNQVRWTNVDPTSPDRDKVGRLSIGDEDFSVKGVVPFTGGFASLEWTGSSKPIPGGAKAGEWRLGLWDMSLPQIAVESLSGKSNQVNADGDTKNVPFPILALGADRYLATATADNLTLTKDLQSVWTTGSENAQLSARFFKDALITQRRDRHEAVTEVCSVRDGSVLNAFPDAKVGRILALSNDYRLAIVTTDMDPIPTRFRPGVSTTSQRLGKRPPPSNVTLTLWSLEENRQLGKVLSYDANDPRAENMKVVFSPDSQWLLIVAGTKLSIWKLPTLEQVGKVALPSPAAEVSFTAGEGRVLVQGNEEAFARLDNGSSASDGDSGPAARRLRGSSFFRKEIWGSIIELDSAKPHYQGRIRTASHAQILISSTKDTLISVASGHEGKVYADIVDLANGKHSEWQVGGQVWERMGDAQAVASFDNTRLLLYGAISGRDFATEFAHAELWDVPSKKLLREFTHPSEIHFPNWQTFATRDTVLLSFEDKGAGRDDRRVNLCWKWTDGQDDPRNGRLLRLRDPQFDFNGAPRRFLVAEDPSHLTSSGRGVNWALQRTDTGVVFRTTGPSDGIQLELAKLPSEVDSYTSDFFLSNNVSAQLSPDSSTLALRSREEKAGLFRTGTGKRICAFPTGHEFSTFDETGRWCLTACRKPEKGGGQNRDHWEFMIWDTQTGGTTRSITLPWPMVPTDMRIHPSGEVVAFQTQGAFVLWDAASNTAIKQFEPRAHVQGITCVAQHPDADLVASGGNAGEILLWKRSSGAQVKGILAHPGPIKELTFHPNGKRLAFCASGNELAMLDLDGNQIWTRRFPFGELESNEIERQIQRSSKPTGVRRLEFHPSGRYLTALSDNGHIFFVNSDTGELIASRALSGELTSLAISSDGTVIAVGSANGNLYLWNVDAAEFLTTTAVGIRINDVAFVGGHDVLATAGEDIQFWNTQSRQKIFGVSVPTPPVRWTQYSDGSGTLYFADESRNVVSYSLGDLQQAMDRLHLGFTERLAEKAAPLDAKSADKWLKLLASKE